MMLAAAGIFLAARRRNRLPYDAEVEYLESTGTQYVLNFYESPGNETSINYEFGATLVKQTSTSQSFFITPTTRNGPRAMYYQSGKIFASCDQNGGVSCGGVSIGTRFDARVAFDAENIIEIAVGSSTVKSTRTFYRCPSIMLFNPNPNYSASAKLYYVRVFVDSTLVRDMIPVRKDGVGYMYDRVSGQLLGSGGGAFVIGPDKVQ